MSIYAFMNSKVLFKDVRHRPYGSLTMPVMVHISEYCCTSLRRAAPYAALLSTVL
jgi:hypothetical protein